jgi:hypothetical protein
MRWKGVDWIYLAQIRDQWLALLNFVMNLRASCNPLCNDAHSILDRLQSNDKTISERQSMWKIAVVA